VFEGTELKRIVPIASPGMARLGRDQVAAGNQFVALDGGVIMDGPFIILENLGGVLDTNS
jgi:hypothetical protein